MDFEIRARQTGSSYYALQISNAGAWQIVDALPSTVVISSVGQGGPAPNLALINPRQPSQNIHASNPTPGNPGDIIWELQGTTFRLYQAGVLVYTGTLPSILPTGGTGNGKTSFQSLQPNLAINKFGVAAFTFTTTPNFIRRISLYLNQTSQQRTLLFSNSEKVYGFNEDGSLFNPEVFIASNGADPPRAVLSRNFVYFTDGLASDLVKWNGSSVLASQANNGLQKWGIDAPTSGVNIAVSSNITGTVTVGNPEITINGWPQGRHVGQYEVTNIPAGLGYKGPLYFFGFNDILSPGDTQPYTNPTFAFDGNTHTKASFVGQSETSPAYGGCVWDFTLDNTTTATSLQLNIDSEVPPSGKDGLLVTGKNAGIWYSFDDGFSWTNLYNTTSRGRNIDVIPIPDGQDLNKIQVMAFSDANANMVHYVYEISITGTIIDTNGIVLTSPAGREYFVVFENSKTAHLSDLSPVSRATGPMPNGQVTISGIAVSSDPQVDKKLILATADGGDQTTLYLIAEIPNGQTSYVDTMPEATLLIQNIFQQTDSLGSLFGVADNTPPPVVLDFPTKHLGRIYGAKDQVLYFSKSIGDLTTSTGTICGRFEEAWPVENQLGISEGVEQVRGLLSDGASLWIGTERHIRKLSGDGPSNFSNPEVTFNQVGLLNQEVWHIVYAEGQPVGACWLTPDFKVMMSDFNTYQNIGIPIQDLLNRITPGSAAHCHASFYAQGSYTLYVLFIPIDGATECNKICVYDITSRTWTTWTLNTETTSSYYDVTQTGVSLWLFAAPNFVVNKFDLTTSKDAGASSTSVIRTSWLSLGDDTVRKLLNEIEVISDATGDLLVKVEGASTDSDFANPDVVKNLSTLTLTPLGTYKFFVASQRTKHRFYRFTFVSSDTTVPLLQILDSYSIEIVPLNRV